MPLKTPPKPKTTTPSTSPKKPVVTKKIPAQLQSAYDKAKREDDNAGVMLFTVKQVFREAVRRLNHNDITSWSITSNTVSLYYTGTFANTHLSDHHWIVGAGKDSGGTYLSGLTEQTFTVNSGGGYVSYSQTRPNGIRSLKPNGTIYSVRLSDNRPTFSTNEWNAKLKSNGYVGDNAYYAMPLPTKHYPGWESGDTAPCTYYTWLGYKGGGDDVEWAYYLDAYYNLDLVPYKAAKHKAYLEAKDAVDREKTILGIPVNQKNTTDVTLENGSGGNNKPSTKPGDKGNSGTTGVGDDTKPVIYNLPGAKDIYFRDNDAAIFVTNGNTPLIVSEAKDLWNKVDGGNSKGMIQSYIVPGAANFSKQTNYYQPGDLLKGNRNINLRRYGFQFTYNPSTVTMDYAGAPQVDIGLETSGLDKVNLIGSGVTSSTVSFQLLLNRMNDMKYIDNILATRNSLSHGTLRADGLPNDKRPISGPMFEDIYSHTGNHGENHDAVYNTNSVNEELRRIKNLGTMYDVEYLLRTLIGYELQSGMRGNVWSSDIGYLGAYPVELHLGKNLRYLVTIDSFSLSHTIFTKDMVPVFTNLSITCNRLPDFAKRFNETTIIPPVKSTTTTTTTTTTK